MGEPALPRTDVKLVEEKRRYDEEKRDIGRRRVKMRDLKSVLRSEGTHSHASESPEYRATSDFGEEVVSQVTKERLEGSRSKLNDERDSLAVDQKRGVIKLDLNSDMFGASTLAGDTGFKHTEEPKEIDVSSLTHGKESKDGIPVSSRGFRFDLNIEDVPSSTNQNPFYPYKNLDQLKPKTVSECGSSTGPIEEKDPLRIWNVMKQNGFLSTSHGGIPMPKQRGRKSKNNALKKKLELAKKEEVDRFTKIAAPSGLLNELNPGIINHVRNRKQVHAIIEALVSSERSANGDVGSKQASNGKGEKDETLTRKELSSNETEHKRFYYAYKNVAPSVSGRKDAVGGPVSVHKPLYLVSGEEREDSDSVCLRGPVNKRFCLNPKSVCQDDALALRLCSTTGKAAEIAYSTPDEDSTTLNIVSSLSMKAATIASRWLELLHQDIKGRLAALRQSKKRVQAVIKTELPFLVTKEFSSNLSNNPHFTKETADIHGSKWTSLFRQMEKALANEEQELEIWLSQVREMQGRCEHGLQLVHCNAAQSMENQLGGEFISRSGTAENSERELAIRAAAASIYSTCNFLLANENISCF